MALLGENSSNVRLAGAGDHVDFVVNLASDEGSAEGRLERETGSGTVAIREVQDENCLAVAEVMALNLSLALDSKPPESPAAVPHESPPLPSANEGNGATDAPAPSEPRPRKDSDETPTAKAISKAPSNADSSGREMSPVTRSSDTDLEWSVGLQGGLLTGLGPSIIARSALFAEGAGVFGETLSGSTLRASAVFAGGVFETDPGRVGQTLWAGRFEVCPLSLGSSKLALRPCVAGELGQIRASGVLSAATLWAAWAVHGRASWSVGKTLNLEAEVGALFPLLSYEVTSGSAVLYTSDLAGLSAVLGASFEF